MNKKIVIITDCVDIASIELRATIGNLLDEQDSHDIQIEPTVSVKPFSIINGSFSLRLLAECYPEGTIFLVVVNPLKIRPKRVICVTKKKRFIIVGADTGIMDWTLMDFGLDKKYEINDPGFVSFGGKYIHAPVTAKIALGENLEKLGTELPVEQIKPQSFDVLLKDMVVHVDNFGLIKISNTVENLEVGAKYLVSVNGKKIIAKYDLRMMSNKTGDWILYNGSSLGLLEIGKVRENGAVELDIHEGNKVHIKKL
jgi:S-adenosylmethionine hydrolase